MQQTTQQKTPALKIKLVLFFLFTLSLGFHVPSDAYAAVDTWTDANGNPSSTRWLGVSMGDANNGVAVGQSDTIVYTADGGDTWTAATTTNVIAPCCDFLMRAVSMGDGQRFD